MSDEKDAEAGSATIGERAAVALGKAQAFANPLDATAVALTAQGQALATLAIAAAVGDVATAYGVERRQDAMDTFDLVSSEFGDVPDNVAEGVRTLISVGKDSPPDASIVMVIYDPEHTPEGELVSIAAGILGVDPDELARFTAWEHEDEPETPVTGGVESESADEAGDIFAEARERDGAAIIAELEDRAKVEAKPKGKKKGKGLAL